MAEKQFMLTPNMPYPNHGNTVASWAMIGIIIVGAIVAAVGFDTFHWPVVIVGASIAVLGIIVGIVLKVAGYGQGGSKTKYNHH